MALVPPAVACPPTQSVNSNKQVLYLCAGVAEAAETFAAAMAAASDAKEPPAMATSQSIVWDGTGAVLVGAIKIAAVKRRRRMGGDMFVCFMGVSLLGYCW